MKIPGFLASSGLWLLLCSAQHLHAQTRQQKDSIAQARVAALIDQQDFTFKADRAFPIGGPSKTLTPDYYDLRIGKDTIVSDLPYYGRAYTAPIDPSKGGIQFTSTNFTYTAVPHKKGDGWDITIKPKDSNDVQQLFLNISSSGYTSLQATFLNRQSISFNGRIVRRKTGRSS